MNPRILKKLSAAAAPLLPLLGDRREQFRAESHRNHHAVFMPDRRHWDRLPCHPTCEPWNRWSTPRGMPRPLHAPSRHPDRDLRRRPGGHRRRRGRARDLGRPTECQSMSAALTRRSFLLSLLAAPFVVRAELLMPIRALVLEPLLAGDHVNFHRDAWRRYGISARGEIVKRIEGDFVVTTSPSARRNEEIRIPRTAVSLFHGLPANRVDNPSMRHRLLRVPGRIGLIYPEDVSEIRRREPAPNADAAERAILAAGQEAGQ